MGYINAKQIWYGKQGNIQPKMQINNSSRITNMKGE